MESKSKAGDKVRIKSLEWYNLNKNEDGEFTMNGLTFTKEMSEYCREEFEISYCFFNGIYLLEGNSWYWSGWMFKGNTNKEQEVKDESIDDIILDMAIIL